MRNNLMQIASVVHIGPAPFAIGAPTRLAQLDRIMSEKGARGALDPRLILEMGFPRTCSPLSRHLTLRIIFRRFR